MVKWPISLGIGPFLIWCGDASRQSQRTTRNIKEHQVQVVCAIDQCECLVEQMRNLETTSQYSSFAFLTTSWEDQQLKGTDYVNSLPGCRKSTRRKEREEENIVFLETHYIDRNQPRRRFDDWAEQTTWRLGQLSAEFRWIGDAITRLANFGSGVVLEREKCTWRLEE